MVLPVAEDVAETEVTEVVARDVVEDVDVAHPEAVPTVATPLPSTLTTRRRSPPSPDRQSSNRKDLEEKIKSIVSMVLLFPIAA